MRTGKCQPGLGNAGAGGEVAHTIGQNGGIFALGFFYSGLEVELAEPVVNCVSVDTGFDGGGGNCASLGKGGDYLSLNRRQVG
jgi:hypothetical protein